jgi:DNA modification methylase
MLPFDPPGKPRVAVPGFAPFYRTPLGEAFLANALDLLRALPEASVNAVITSPPYALHFNQEYGNAAKHDYVKWFLPFAREIFRVLAPDGSFVLNIAGSYNEGVPTRSLYHFKLLLALVEQVRFNLAQECFWFNPAKFGNNAANDLYTERCKEAGVKIHPTRFPAALPQFFLRLLTDEDDVVLDPFAGSNTTGAVAEALHRRWIAVEKVQTYLEASKFRFNGLQNSST